MAVVRPGRLIYVGQMAAAHRHRHAAIQVVVATGAVRLRDAAGDQLREQAAVIPPGVEHELAGESSGMVVFVDGGGHLGQALTTLVRRTGLAPQSAAAWATAARPLLGHGFTIDGAPAQMAEGALSKLVAGTAPPDTPMHPALQSAVALLPDMLSSSVSLGEIAAAVGISASRLGHLFTDELGLPFRPYLRWARLRRVITHVRQGHALTEAAHASGFADSAHLTRACHDMFGLPPSHLKRCVSWHEPVR
ncbi:helix-turn-helix domain-containing protein [Lentzea sp. HUAS TT2]|uniref:AraC family transcriptional regulator n=1 Tax=Lentzea sp. HUAS TT2 TaxID=3447454 RepID=UPI003F6F1CDE